jgi:hypothetical protein
VSNFFPKQLRGSVSRTDVQEERSTKITYTKIRKREREREKERDREREREKERDRERERERKKETEREREREKERDRERERERERNIYISSLLRYKHFLRSTVLPRKNGSYKCPFYFRC